MIKLTFNGTVLIETDEPLPSSQAGGWFTVRCDGFQMKARAPMAYTLPSDRMVNVQVSYTDSKGNPATVDGDVVWASADASLVAVAVDPADSTKASVTPGSGLGQGQVTATADADLGAGVTTLVCVLDVVVIAGTAVAGTITPVGDPVPLP
jgi:hypothetical protein